MPTSSVDERDDGGRKMVATWWGIPGAVLLKGTALKGQRNNIVGVAFGNKNSD